MSTAENGPAEEAERRISEAARNQARMLDLSLLGLTAVPDSIGQLSSLAILHLFHNRLTAVPDSIGQLTDLIGLWLDDNQLTALPDSIGQLTGLTRLILTGNRLTALPASIGQLTSLRVLVIEGNPDLPSPPASKTLSAYLQVLLADFRVSCMRSRKIIGARRESPFGVRSRHVTNPDPWSGAQPIPGLADSGD